MQQIDHKTNIIELQDVSFSYSNEKETAVENISLVIHKGDYLGVVGPNGAGKSTLLKLLLGILKPQKGKIKLFGTDISQFKDRSKIGYISQQVAHIDPHFPMTAQEAVMMGRYPKLGLFRFPSQKDRDIVTNALNQVDMLQYKNKLVGDLSGGQQQRIFIARVLAGQPEVIVLDEPTVGVDMKTQKQFYDLLRKLNKELELTLVLVSHELDVVAHEATELVYINRTIVFYGDPHVFLHGEYFHQLTGHHGGGHHHA